jgi:hypothetical protein
VNATISTSESADRQASLTDHLRTTRATIVQTKWALKRLERFCSSAQTRDLLDRLCVDMDAARTTLELLDFGSSVGSAS